MKKKFHHNQASDEVLEFVHRSPGFLERNGIYIIVTICIILLFSSIFVRYPDKIVQQAHLSNQNSIKPITSDKDGIIYQFVKKDNDTVTVGDPLIWLQSPIHKDTILAIDRTLRFTIGRKIMEKRITIADYNLLYSYLEQIEGSEIFQDYKLFLNDLGKYQQTNYYNEKAKKITALEQNISTKRRNIVKSELQELQADSTNKNEDEEFLYRNRLITYDQYVSYKSQKTAKNISVSTAKDRLLNSDLSETSAASRLSDLQNNDEQAYLNLVNSFITVKNAIKKWIISSTVPASQNGIVELNPLLQVGDRIMKNSNIGYIIPKQSGFLLKCYFKQTSLTKIKKNTPVEIRLDAYPYKEYGVLSGKIVSLSEVVTDSGAMSSVYIANGLTTSLGKKLQYKENLRAEVVVTSDNKSLFERIITSLVKGQDEK